MKSPDRALLERAKRAFLRTQGAPMPSDASYVEQLGERRVAVLVNVNGLLATYHDTGDLSVRSAASDTNVVPIRDIQAPLSLEEAEAELQRLEAATQHTA